MDLNLASKDVETSETISKRVVSFETDLPFLKRIKVSPSVQFENPSTAFVEETILGSFGCDNNKAPLKTAATIKRSQSSDAESCWSGATGNQDFDIKPNILSDSNGFYNKYIKTEVNDIDESYSINTELTIKNEPIENSELLIHELTVPELVKVESNNKIESTGNNKIESTETFLSRNPDIFTKFCGLPDFNMFNALFNYVEKDMRDIKEATKFEQLFSVLAKLHKNEDNLYLNKYLFPATYVYVVELLYKKLELLCRKVGTIGIPEVLTPNFDSSQKVVIIGIMSLSIKTSPNGSNRGSAVKYLVGYTAFGDVFFVSKYLPTRMSIKKLIYYSGLLDTLQKDYWILFNEGEDIFVTLVEKLKFEKPLFKEELYSKTIQNYVMRVVNRLPRHFKVLQSNIPDFMLFSKDREVCFLDELMFVCCMIMNLLRRCAYK